MAQSPARSPSRNPMISDPDREQRVRERAYLLWESEGKPHGRDVEFWERARELVSQDESTETASGAEKKSKSEKSSKSAKPQTQVGPADEAEADPTSRKRARAKPRKPAKA